MLLLNSDVTMLVGGGGVTSGVRQPADPSRTGSQTARTADLFHFRARKGWGRRNAIQAGRETALNAISQTGPGRFGNPIASLAIAISALPACSG